MTIANPAYTWDVAFVGALWLVLWMGASLFALVKLNFLKDLLGEAWFNVPVICFAWVQAGAQRRTLHAGRASAPG